MNLKLLATLKGVVPGHAQILRDPLRAKVYCGAICPHCGEHMALKLEVKKRFDNPTVIKEAQIHFHCTGWRKHRVRSCGFSGTVEYPHWLKGPFHQPTRQELEETILQDLNGQPAS